MAIFSSFNVLSQPTDLVKRAELNDPRAQFELGQLYANGNSVSKDSAEALKWFSKSATYENADAIARIGIMHAEGEGIPKDYAKAIDFYRRAIKLGGNRGMVAYARALIRGEGTTKNVELAHQLLKTAVSNNSPAAMFTLGFYYKNNTIKGTGGEKLIAAAADRGYQDAIVEISLDDILNQKDPIVAKDAFNKILPYKNKSAFADFGIAYYYMNFTTPPAIESAKELIEPYLETHKLITSMLMVEISQASGDYPGVLRYMQYVNDESPNKFDLKKARAEYSKYIEQKKMQEMELSKQAAFIDSAINAQKESISAQNDMQRGGIKAGRDSAICKILTNRNVNNWVGYIENLSANSDGLGVLSITIAQNVTIKTWNNSLSDIGSKTLISPESQIFKTASQLRIGQKVAFSGIFIAGNSRECVRESSLSLSGSLSAPEFIFRFSKITAIQ